MRLRRARTLVVTFAGSTPVIRNFMTHHQLPVDGFTLELLSKADSWQLPEAFYSMYPGIAPSWIEAYLRGMTEQGWLIIQNSAAAALDAEYETSWAWDATAGLYHFGIQDPPWLNPVQSAQWMHHISAVKPPLPLLTTNHGLAHVVGLRRPDLEQGLFATMKRRRSVRTFEPKPVSGNALRDCLFAGLGITGFLDTQLPGEEPRVPLKMTPSGGARNPYEAYVYVKNVEGLESGLYHYSALDNSLGLLTQTPAVTTTQLFAGQDWTEGAALAILLVANFDRTMWKYPHPNAYRVVLMEAGHIGQNISLAAADHGLCATPTGAITDAAAQALLGLNRVKQALVYGLFIGHPHPEAFETQHFIPPQPG